MCVLLYTVRVDICIDGAYLHCRTLRNYEYDSVGFYNLFVNSALVLVTVKTETVNNKRALFVRYHYCMEMAASHHYNHHTTSCHTCGHI